MKSPKKTAYALLRVTMGCDIMLHGLVRFPKIAGFREWMVSTLKGGLIPEFMVYSWATILPFIEFTIGILLILGLFTQRAILAGGIVLAILIIGSCANEKWEWAGIQIVYVLLYYLLTSKIEDNCCALDNIFKSKKIPTR